MSLRSSPNPGGSMRCGPNPTESSGGASGCVGAVRCWPDADCDEAESSYIVPRVPTVTSVTSTEAVKVVAALGDALLGADKFPAVKADVEA